MKTDHASARSALDDIARVEARTGQAAIYGSSSAITILWGVVVAIANGLHQFFSSHASAIWLCAWAAGLIGSVLISRKWKQQTPQKSGFVSRLVWTQLVLILFGFLILWLLPPSSPRQIAALWPLIFMTAYVLVGLWLGRFFILCGLFVGAMIVLGYLYSGPWLPLWMACANGGALIASGLYLRRVGLQL